MKYTPKQIEAVAEILHNIVVNDDIKLAYGKAIRSQIKKALSKGEKPSGYRVDWLYKTRDRLTKALEEAAIEFNETYKHDRISVADMLDALASSTHQFKTAIAKKLKETG